MKCLASTHIYFIWVAQSYPFYQRNRSIVHGGERDTLSEAVVSFRTVVCVALFLLNRYWGIVTVPGSFLKGHVRDVVDF